MGVDLAPGMTAEEAQRAVGDAIEKATAESISRVQTEPRLPPALPRARRGAGDRVGATATATSPAARARTGAGEAHARCRDRRVNDGRLSSYFPALPILGQL